MNIFILFLNILTQMAFAESVDGAAIYRKVCQNCHNMNGMGISPVYPPLVGSKRMLSSDVTVPIRIVLHGLEGPITVGEKTYNTMAMTAQSHLSNAEVAAVITMIRTAWGNQASAVTVEQVEAVREKYSLEQPPWTAETLRLP